MKRPANPILAGFLVATGCAGPAAAHDYSGGGLGPSSGATDYHVISCNDDGSGPPAFLSFQLNAGPPVAAPLVSAQIQVPGRPLAGSVTDPQNGDVQSSRIIEVAAGEAAYQVTVDKAGPGKAGYSFSYHCETANGEHTGTDLVTLQDQ